jgi:hypothetical protein
LLAEAVLDELAHFASALADECNHIHFGGGVAGNHAHQGAFADAAAREDADTLSVGAGEQGVDGAYPQRQRHAQGWAFQRGGRFGEQWVAAVNRRGGLAVDGVAQSVQHAPQQRVRHAH